MPLFERIYTGVLIRIYLLLKKYNLLKSSNVYITAGFLKNYKWSLYTSDETYLSGNYDTDTLRELKNHIKESNVVYDLGANEGYFSLIASRLAGGKGHVYAFEPIPENISKITNHVKVNSVKNISIIEKAVSDKTGSLLFSKTNDQAGNTYLENSPKFSESTERLEVKSVKLDDFCSNNEIRPPDVIKIDVEGAEYDVLCGARQTIEHRKPTIILATHDFHIKGIKKKCIDLLESMGYKANGLPSYSGNPEFEDFVLIHSDKVRRN